PTAFGAEPDRLALVSDDLAIGDPEWLRAPWPFMFGPRLALRLPFRFALRLAPRLLSRRAWFWLAPHVVAVGLTAVVATTEAPTVPAIDPLILLLMAGFAI